MVLKPLIMLLIRVYILSFTCFYLRFTFNLYLWFYRFYILTAFVIYLINSACNYAKGKWVVDEKEPSYSGFGCKQWLSGMWACRLTQRTDFSYEKLRWQPKNCEMERFKGSEFLKRYSPFEKLQILDPFRLRLIILQFNKSIAHTPQLLTLLITYSAG